MGKNKMIAKSCPKCEMQVAVASKSCKCGHAFFLSRRGADSLARVEPPPGAGDELRRRTARVRRSQTQFYDAQHYQKQKRRSPKKRSLSESIDQNYKNKEKESATARARRRRALRRAQREHAAGAGGGAGAGAGGGGGGAGGGAGGAGAELLQALQPGQLVRCELILQEINRKMRAVTWQPPSDL